ncbi:FKBP-type peptidyl-prolyl cis-trans isomerase 1 [Rothia mucilaginosa DY-18]|uniref:Peptidyl-prolyl cis-trans isomerase n=3 Tax=Rothia TaxID=32207 RepID=D2NT96_ROTMD|nr:FKBP-type peptidyl-prolyl cis-trans isomerase 1 [Rothia mucilaginosa DY-18]
MLAAYRLRRRAHPLFRFISNQSKETPMSFGQRNLDREKPEIDFPEGDAPTELVITDLIEGAGAEVVPGSRVLTHYVGVAFSTGEEFDASWNRGEPLPFQVGVGQVIRGWDEGLLGMKVGGRRRLEIPADMAYGDRGAGSVIKPGESLIFVVDLLDVR